MQAQPSKWTMALGGLIGAALALVGIVIGSTVARLTVPEHHGAHESATEHGD